jgi:hypothetical protein
MTFRRSRSGVTGLGKLLYVVGGWVSVRPSGCRELGILVLVRVALSPRLQLRWGIGPGVGRVLQPAVEHVERHHPDGHQAQLSWDLPLWRAAVRLWRLWRGVMPQQHGALRPADGRLELLPRHDHPQTLLPSRCRRYVCKVLEKLRKPTTHGYDKSERLDVPL